MTSMTDQILQHLKLKKSPPKLVYLQELITAYCTHVPWESISKIVRKNFCSDPAKCLRLENEFWTSAFDYGTGGTCYESNWAFFYLLQRLGFKGYLTINKVQDKSSVHSAIIIFINGDKYLVDVGYPLYGPIPVVDQTVTTLDNLLINYRCTPISSIEYIIENYPHPKPYLYHLLDAPVPSADYLKVARDDYGEDGLFSNRIVIRKLIGGVPTRFDSEDLPFNIHTLLNGEKHRTFLKEENLFPGLSEHFTLNAELVRSAFSILDKNRYHGLQA